MIGCAVSAAIVLFAAGRAWVSFSVVDPSLPQLHETASGHDVAGAVTPLAFVVLAGVVAYPATRRVGRRIAGALVALAGIGVLIEASLVLTSPGSAVTAQAARLAGRSGVHPSGVSVSGWPWAVVVAGLIAVAAGVLAVFAGREWPTMGRRYESGGRPPKTAAPASMWDRIDEGDDPTV